MVSLLASIATIEAAPERLILEGVPKIGYGVHLCPFPGSVFSVMKYLGEPVDYDMLMGVTGAAFRRFWNRDDGGNVDLMYLAPEPYLRAQQAIGYELLLVAHRAKPLLMQAIRENIGRGNPVLAFGIIGPPECGIVAGYDKGGEVLYGYSYFQDAKLPGYYEKADWYEKAEWAGECSLLVLGEKKPLPNKRDLLISSLKWAVDLARKATRANVPDHTSGLAAYDSWAAGCEVDADYPKGDPKVLATRVMVHGDQCVMLEERRDAASFLRKMADADPEAAVDITAAAALYDQAANYGGQIWLWGNEMGETAQRGLADPATRREIARNIRLAREKEAKAVEHLEAALKVLVPAK